MTLLKIVNILIFKFLVLHAATEMAELKCGIYEAQGIIKMNNQRDFVLVIRHKTFSPFELILLGGDINEKWEHLNMLARIKFYVPFPIKAKLPPYVFVQSFLKVDFSIKPQNYLRLIKEYPCWEKKYFK